MRTFVLFLALKHIRRRALQSTLTIMGVAVGVMVLVTALSLTNGFIDELLRSTLQATPHVTLQSFDGGFIPDDRAVLERIAQHPQVVAVSPFISTQALITRRADATIGLSARTGYTQIIGIDPVLQQRVLDLEEITMFGSDLVEGGGIVLGGTLARSLNVFTEEEVQVVNVNSRRRPFRVAGTFRVNNELIDSVLSYVSIPGLQDYLNAEGQLSGYHVRIHDPEQATRVAIALGGQFGLLPGSWQNLFGTLVEQMRLQKAVIGVVVFLIIIVAAMGIANILVLTVAEKTEEIAILRALGASQRQILSVFTLEGIILGGGGTLLGALLGLGLSLYFKFQPYPLPGDLYFITQLPVELQAWDFIWVCALALGTSVVASIIPARRASGLEPADILR